MRERRAGAQYAEWGATRAGLLDPSGTRTHVTLVTNGSNLGAGLGSNGTSGRADATGR
jgi:hypothetical protein